MLKKINSDEFAEEIKISCNTNLNPNKIITKRINPRKSVSFENLENKKSYCEHVCEAIPLVFKNFKLKMSDHLLLGGEHIHKVSPGYNSPLKRNCDEEISSEEKKEIAVWYERLDQRLPHLSTLLGSLLNVVERSAALSPSTETESDLSSDYSSLEFTSETSDGAAFYMSLSFEFLIQILEKN